MGCWFGAGAWTTCWGTFCSASCSSSASWGSWAAFSPPCFSTSSEPCTPLPLFPLPHGTDSSFLRGTSFRPTLTDMFYKGGTASEVAPSLLFAGLKTSWALPLLLFMLFRVSMARMAVKVLVQNPALASTVARDVQTAAVLLLYRFAKSLKRGRLLVNPHPPPPQPHPCAHLPLPPPVDESQPSLNSSTSAVTCMLAFKHIAFTQRKLRQGSHTLHAIPPPLLGTTVQSLSV